jgi:hypothetical protein
MEERIEVADNQSVAAACLESCNSMRHLPESDESARLACLQRWAGEGAVINCAGPRPGLHQPICRLPELTKRHTEAQVRPLMYGNRALLAGE